MNIARKSRFFDLTPGKIIDLQIDHPVKVRIKAALVGYDVGNYIILKHPAPMQMSNYSDVLVEGNVVVVRYLLEGQQGECYAFKASIRNITKFPEKLIFLSYPQQIENRQLRTHQRFITHLPATIFPKEEQSDKVTPQLKGIISDISSKGCGFVFKSNNSKLKVNQKEIFVTIRTATDGDITIPARVCNSRFDDGKINVGIQFNEDDEQIKVLLEQLFIEL
ncbi:PilZ domain-containing protein [Shewanella sp. SR44-3]|uniref:PilZ domain-containing protein n=1 Tax=unclassified Shewanella TaxID=196818 RepID=UPI0015F7E28A|nr:PilZ domain-containing protein [Shewanella sp. SR44-3]MBB1268849.1 flagellar brake domain-containing protein [Shewanella sp. SR44-3]